MGAGKPSEEAPGGMPVEVMAATEVTHHEAMSRAAEANMAALRTVYVTVYTKFWMAVTVVSQRCEQLVSWMRANREQHEFVVTLFLTFMVMTLVGIMSIPNFSRQPENFQTTQSVGKIGIDVEKTDRTYTLTLNFTVPDWGYDAYNTWDLYAEFMFLLVLPSVFTAASFLYTLFLTVAMLAATVAYGALAVFAVTLDYGLTLALCIMYGYMMMCYITHPLAEFLVPPSSNPADNVRPYVRKIITFVCGLLIPYIFHYWWQHTIFWLIWALVHLLKLHTITIVSTTIAPTAVKQE